MKKAMLYISLIMSGIYAVAVCFVIALQELLRNAQGFKEQVPFIIPVPSVFLTIIMVMMVVVFDILLLRSADDMRTHIETAAVVVLSVFMVFMPWIFNLGMIIQVRYYAYSIGAMGVAAYNLLHQGITACNPILVFSMLLQIVYAGISLGRKGR